jgi:hypothetical protein
MNGAPAPRIERSALVLGSPLGKGGQGHVTQVSNIKLNKQWPAVVKQYSPEAKLALRLTALEAITAFPPTLAPRDGRWLYETTAWPSAIVEDNGKACGFLMRAVPSTFYFDFQTRSMGLQKKLADMAFLLNSEDYVRSSGIIISNWDRLVLLRSVASMLSRLHFFGISVGDFSPKNILFAFKPSPMCFLIDCDAVRLHGYTVLDQVETPDWETPIGEPKATTATDAYKFGLLAIRLFARDQSSRDITPLRAVAPELGQLAQLSQHPDPRLRPPPSTWVTALFGAATSASAMTSTRANSTQPSVPQSWTPPPRPVSSASTVRPSPPAPSLSVARAGTRGCMLFVACFVVVVIALGLIIMATS